MESLIRVAILAITSQNSRGRIGNRNLIQQVRQAGEAAGHAFSELVIQAVCEQLIAEGVLGKGRGRGGSVYRTDAVHVAQSADESAAAPPEPVPAQGEGQYNNYKPGDQATLRPDVGV